jgi:hypothetical protein
MRRKHTDFGDQLIRCFAMEVELELRAFLQHDGKNTRLSVVPVKLLRSGTEHVTQLQ